MITSNGVQKSFCRTTKLILVKNSLFYYIQQVDNILLLSVQLYIHGKHHNVVRISVSIIVKTSMIIFPSFFSRSYFTSDLSMTTF